MKTNWQPKASYLFGKRERRYQAPEPPFEKRFPTIEDIIVEVTESCEGPWGGGKRVFQKGDLWEYVDCSKPECYGGGFSIDQIIEDMIGKKEAKREATEFCMGTLILSPGGQRKSPCDGIFQVQVQIKYKPAPVQE